MRDRLGAIQKSFYNNMEHSVHAAWACVNTAGSQLGAGVHYVQQYVASSTVVSCVKGVPSIDFEQYARAVWQDAEKTRNQLYEGAHYVQKYVATTPWVKTATKNTARQVLQGFSRAYYPSNLTNLFDRPGTTRALWYGVTANLWYLSGVLSYYWLTRRMLRTIPGMQDSYPEYVLDCAAYLYICSQFKIKLFVDNTFYNMVTAKVSAQEAHQSKHFGPCECGLGKQLKGMLGSPIYLLADETYAWVVSHTLEKLLGSLLPPMIAEASGWTLKSFLRSLRFGQVLLEYKLAAKGMCTEHRYAMLTKNNRYAFGLGLSYFFQWWLFSFALEQGLNVKNEFTEDAISSGLFLYFIYVAQTINKALPDQENGIDFFKPCRKMTSVTLSYTTRLLADFLDKKENRNFIEQSADHIKKFPPFARAAQLVRNLFLDDKIASIDDKVAALCQLDSARLYFEYGIDDFKGVIADIRAVRESIAHHIVGTYFPYMLKADTRKLLNILLDNRLEGTLAKIEVVLERVDLESRTSSRIHQTVFIQAINTFRSKFGLTPLKHKALNDFVQEDYADLIALNPNKAGPVMPDTMLKMAPTLTPYVPAAELPVSKNRSAFFPVTETEVKHVLPVPQAMEVRNRRKYDEIMTIFNHHPVVVTPPLDVKYKPKEDDHKKLFMKSTNSFF